MSDLLKKLQAAGAKVDRSQKVNTQGSSSVSLMDKLKSAGANVDNGRTLFPTTSSSKGTLKQTLNLTSSAKPKSHEQMAKQSLVQAQAASKRMSDIEWLYGGKKNEDGSIVFPSQKGLDAYNELAQEQNTHVNNASAFMAETEKVANRVKSSADSITKFFNENVWRSQQDLNGIRSQINILKKDMDYLRSNGYEIDDTVVSDYYSALDSARTLYGSYANADEYDKAVESSKSYLSFEEKYKSGSADIVGLSAVVRNDEVRAKELEQSLKDDQYMLDNWPGKQAGHAPTKEMLDEQAVVWKRMERSRMELAELRKNAPKRHDEYVAYWAFTYRDMQEADAESKMGSAKAFNSLEGDAKEIYQILLYLENPKRKDINFGTFDAVEVNGNKLDLGKLARMTDNEKAMFFYLCNSGESDKAMTLMKDVSDQLVERYGSDIAEAFDVPVLREAISIANGLGKGVQNIGYGLASTFADLDVPKATEMDIMQSYWQEKHKGDLAYYTTGAANTIGNMLPAVAGYSVNPVVGTMATFFNSRGSAYAEARKDGANHQQAWLHSSLSGAAEAGLEALLGGAGGIIGGKLSGLAKTKLGKLLGKLSSNKLSKIAVDFVSDVGGEVLEENLQLFLDPAFKMFSAMSDQYDAPSMDDILETTIMTAISSAVFFGNHQIAEGKNAKAQAEYTSQVKKTMSAWENLEGVPVVKDAVQALQRHFAENENITPEEFGNILKKYGGMVEVKATESQYSNSVAAKTETELRADLVQAENPKATVIRSESVQAYIDTGKVALKNAQKASAVLDAIVIGEKTELSNNEIDSLMLTTTAGSEVASKILGIEVPRFTEKATARTQFRSIMAQYAETSAESQNIAPVATEENGGQIVQPVAETSAAPTASVPVEAYETSLPADDQFADPVVDTAPEVASTDSDFVAENAGYTAPMTINSDAGLDSSNQSASQPRMGYMAFAEKYRQYFNKNATDNELGTAYHRYSNPDEGGEYHGVRPSAEVFALPVEAVKAVDSLGKLFGLDISFENLGNDNGYYVVGTNKVVMDIDPKRNDAGNAFLFTASHELGHAIRDRIGKEAWSALEEYAIATMGGKKAVQDKQKQNAVYRDEADAREDVACDFLGELMSDKNTLDTFCKAVEKGQFNAEYAKGIGGLIQKLADKISAAKLSKAIKKRWGKDIANARNAAQAILKAAEVATAVQKNATNAGVVKQNIKRTQDMTWTDQVNGALYNGGNIRRNDTLIVANSADTMLSGSVEQRHLAIPQSIITKAQSGKDISHSIKRGKLAKLDEGIKNARMAIVNPDRNAIVYVTNISQGGMPIVVSFDMNAVFDGDLVHKATSIHLQIDLDSMLRSLPDSATIYAEKKELDPVGATNNLRGLAAKIKFVDTITDKPVFVNTDDKKRSVKTKADLAQLDADYIAAVESGDMETAQRMVDEAAKKAGYTSSDDWRMAHRAPTSKGDTACSMDQIDTAYGGDGSIYSFRAVQYYGEGRDYDRKAFNVIRSARSNPDKMITIYRAVPTDIQDSRVRNGDWISITREYAEEHGERTFDDGYRILENKAPAKHIYGNGDSIHEWGYDNGDQSEVYKNAAGNVKLAAVTYDDNGNVIPLSERFNEKKPDIRYSKKEFESAGTEDLYKGKDLSSDSSVYDYDFLVSLPPMRVPVMPPLSSVKAFDDAKNQDNVSPEKAAELGMENARAYGGNIDNDGTVYLKNRYTGHEIKVSITGLRHSINGDKQRLRTNARLSSIGGDLIVNAVPINGLKDESPTVNGTYAMAVLANSGSRNVVAIITVEMRTNNLLSIDFSEITHSISGRLAKKESNVLAARAQGNLNEAPYGVTLDISIADFLSIVNRTYQSILPDDVLNHFKEKRDPKGHYTPKVKFSKKDKVPGTDTYTEQHGIEIQSDTQLERAMERSEARADLERQYASAGQSAQEAQDKLKQLHAEEQADKRKKLERDMFTPPKRSSEKSLYALSRAELRSRVLDAEKRLSDAVRTSRILFQQKEQAKAQMLPSNGVNLDPTGVYQFVRTLMKQNENPDLSHKAVKDVADRLMSVFTTTAAMVDQLGFDQAMEYLYCAGSEIAETILGNGITYSGGDFNNTLYATYSNVRDYLRSTTILLPKQFANDVSPDFSTWRNGYRGKINVKLVNDGTGNVDSVYGELGGLAPWLARNGEMSEAGMILEIAKAVDAIYASKNPDVTYSKAFSEDQISNMNLELVSSMFMEFDRVFNRPRLKTKMDKVIEAHKKHVAEVKADARQKQSKAVADAEAKARKDQEQKDTGAAVRIVSWYEKELGKIEAKYQAEIDRVKRRAAKNEHKAAMEAALIVTDKAAKRADAEAKGHKKEIDKLDRQSKRKIENLRRSMGRAISRLERRAEVLATKLTTEGSEVDSVMSAFRKRRAEIYADRDDIHTEIVSAEEIRKRSKAKKAKNDNALRRLSDSFTRAFVTDTLDLERFSKLQTRPDTADVRLTMYRNRGATTETIQQNYLMDPSGDIIDERSLASVALCWEHDKVGGKVDKNRQKVFQSYLYHRHGFDRMNVKNKAQVQLDAFLDAHPEFDVASGRALAEGHKRLSRDDILLLQQKGDALATEYVELCRQYSAAKNKPVMGDEKGHPVSADTHKAIADDLEKNNPWLKEKSDTLYEWWDKFMMAWVVGSELSLEQYAAMKDLYPHYVPTYRAFDKSDRGVFVTDKNGMTVKKSIRAAKGSTMDLMSVDDSLAVQVAKIVENHRFNELAMNIIDEVLVEENMSPEMFDYAVYDPYFKTNIDFRAKDMDNVSEDIEGAHGRIEKDGKSVKLTAWSNGEAISVNVSAGMARSLESLMGKNDRFEKLVKAGSVLTNPMKTAITGINPFFAARNVSRDQTLAMVNSVAGPHKFPLWTARAISHMVQQSTQWKQFVALGGTGSSHYASEHGFANSLKGDGVGKKALKVAGAFNEASEAMTRFAEYLATIDKVGDTAEGRALGIKNAAEVTVDFSRHGEYGKLLNAWIPYWNPAVQGMSRLVRSVMQDKSVKGALKTLGKATAVSVLPEALLMGLLFAFGGYDEWEEFDDRSKDAYYLIPIGDGKAIKIAKGREWAQIIGNPIMRVVQGIKGREDPFENYWETSIVPNFMPPTIADAIGLSQKNDLETNKDFAGRTIIPKKYEKAYAEEQYDEATSFLARILGKAFKISPMKIDYVIGDYFGDFGDIFIEVFNGQNDNAMDFIKDVFTSPFVADSAYSNHVNSEYYDMIDYFEAELSTMEIRHGIDYTKESQLYSIHQAVDKYFSEPISKLNKAVRESKSGEESRKLKMEIRSIQQEALDFYEACMAGEIEDPVRYLDYAPYGDTVRNELIRLKDYEDSDYTFTPSTNAPKIGDHVNTDEEKSAFVDIYNSHYASEIGSVISSDQYQKSSDEEKLSLLEGARELAYFYAKKEWATKFGIKSDSYDPETESNKFDTLIKAGLSYFDAYTIKDKYNEIRDSAEYSSNTLRATAFAAWVDGQSNWSAEQKAMAKSSYKFTQTMVVGADKYDKLAGLGLSSDRSNAVVSIVSAVQPLAGEATVSDIRKWQAIVNSSELSDSEKDKAIRAYMDSDNLSKYDACSRAGVTAREYVALRTTVNNLKPLKGNQSVTAGQKWDACIKAVSGDKKQDALLRSYMSDEQVSKYDSCSKSGVTAAMYVEYYNAKYSYGDSNGSWKQEELKNWLNSKSWSNKQKSALWTSTNSGWKYNPFA